MLCPNPNEYWSTYIEVAVRVHEYTRPACAIKLLWCIFGHASFALWVSVCSCVANAHCVHTCHDVACTHVYSTGHIFIHSIRMCVSWCMNCSLLYNAHVCAAGIKKYIVGLVIKLSSDPESAEVNCFRSAAPSKYLTSFTELWKK